MMNMSATLRGRVSLAVRATEEASSVKVLWVQDVPPLMMPICVGVTAKAPLAADATDITTSVTAPVMFCNASACAEPSARPASTPRPWSHPRTNSPRRSGRLKVVLPSPAPNAVPMAAYSAA